MSEAIEAKAEENGKVRTLAPRKPRADAVALQLSTPMEMIAHALSRGDGADTLGKLMDLQERWERNEARKAFDEAIAAAKSEIKPIAKNRHVGFDSKKQGSARTDYKHEDLAEIARTVDPVLSRHGLSYRFRTTSAPNEPITVTCIVSHRLGHSEENTLCAGRDDTGNKNSIQQVGSTITYLQRYTLKAALGLAASNDDDGKGADDDTKISPEQVEHIQKLIIEAAPPNSKDAIPIFLNWAGLERIEDMLASQYDKAIAGLKLKISKKAKAS